MKRRPDSGDPVIDEVLVTANLLRERANLELQTCGLSLWTFKALKVLDAAGPIRSVDLGEAMGIAARTVTGAVDTLEAQGLVERRPHPTDRRAHLIVLTPQGAERLVEARKVHRALVDRAGHALDDTQRAHLLELLGLLAAATGPAAVDLAM